MRAKLAGLPVHGRPRAGHGVARAGRDPGDPEATFNRGVHEWALGALDDAELARRFGAARKSHASAAWSHHLAARMHASLGDFAQALADLDEAARHGAAEAYLARERALAHAGQAAQREDAAAFTRAREAVSLTLRPGEAETLDLPGQERSATLRGLAAGATTVAVTPDAEQIVAGGGGREARVWGRGAAPLRKIVAEDGRLRALAIHRELLKRREVSHGCYVHALKPREQFQEVVERLQLGASARPFVLCLHCNLPLRPAQKAEVLDRLPPRIAQLYEHFCTCDGCGRVFWEGSHWDRMRGWLRHAVPGLPR